MKKEIIKLLQETFILHKKFDKTRGKKWSILQVFCELNIQVGQLGFLIINNYNKQYKEFLEEKDRNINNINDEICDCVLQIGTILNIFDFNIFKIFKDFSKYRKKLENNSIFLYSSLSCFSQRLLESALRIENYRFRKNISKYYKNDEKLFIYDQIGKMIIILLKFIKIFKINIFKEFRDMEQDATKFLNNYEAFSIKQIEACEKNNILFNYINKKMDNKNDKN